MDSSQVSELTQREIDVVALASIGHTNAGIGHRLHISPSTVKSHLRTISDKLRTYNRTHTVAVALRSGIIE